MFNLKLKEFGHVDVNVDSIGVRGFEADGATCRDVVALALVWAIGELQKELHATISAPGGDHSFID